jgi:hypothetical protein
MIWNDLDYITCFNDLDCGALAQAHNSLEVLTALSGHARHLKAREF